MDKNELCLHRANQFGDLVQIATMVTKYTSRFGIFIKILHLEGEEMFGSSKRKENLPLGSKVDSHRLDRVNLSCSKVANAMVIIN